MSTESAERLEQARQLAAEGRSIEAREIVVELTEQDKSNVDAWWARAQLANSDKERRFAVYQVLALEPEHTEANWVLGQMRSNKLDSLDPPPPPPEPINSRDVATGCFGAVALVVGGFVLTILSIFATIFNFIFGRGRE